MTPDEILDFIESHAIEFHHVVKGCSDRNAFRLVWIDDSGYQKTTHGCNLRDAAIGASLELKRERKQ